MLKNLLYIIVLLLGFPAGIYLAWLCKDEIKSWKKRMIAMSIISLILGFIAFFIDLEYKIPIAICLFFITITFLTIVWKSHY